MEFGKLADIKDVDWALPEDDARMEGFLTSSERRLKIRLGAPAWGHKDWIGKVYPSHAKRENFLKFYSEFFGTIELNTSHYRIPDGRTVEGWLRQVPHEFRFCPKIYQGISHAPRGLMDKALLGSWFKFLEGLGVHLGPSFLQLPPYFAYGSKLDLFTFLKQWPDAFPLAIEFRHPTWFHQKCVLPALVDYLNKRQMGLVMTDVAGRRDVLHGSISANFALLRFVGNDLDPSDAQRAEGWAKRVSQWEAKGLRELYLFIHEPEDLHVPEMTRIFANELKRNGLEVGVPGLIESIQLEIQSGQLECI